jgi:capsular polysaccharide export protein
MRAGPILAIPPFPGARPPRFAEPDDAAGQTMPCEALLEALAHHRVGGWYWGRQRTLPDHPFILDGTGEQAEGAVSWAADEDPWHLLGRAAYARLTEDDPRGLLAMGAGVPVVLLCADGSVRDAKGHDAQCWSRAALTGWRYRNPFDGTDLTAMEAIALCGFWRQLIDINRPIKTVMGIAYWKKPTVTALLWGGSDVPYSRSVDELPQGAAVAIWRSRLSRAQARRIEEIEAGVIEIEDGFIRSQGLGADCVPPLSIIVDDAAPHFVPGAPSGIERLLQSGDFPPDLVARARALREAIIAGVLSKYERGQSTTLPRPGGDRNHVLVPGQVEDDRAVTSGGALPSNLELLRRARAEAGPDAYLIYKPHPDVLAGHRRGLIPEREIAALADRVETDAPMAALIAMVDELHVNSSLAGFEALMRGKRVTVHGVPFYAGWGLTEDRGAVPARRTARRTLDELVAAALLLYPRYLDPVTGLPCPAEVLVERLSTSAQTLDTAAKAIVTVRRAVGRVRRLVAH